MNLFFSNDRVNGKSRCRVWHVSNHVDVVLINPLARSIGGDVGLVLVVGRDDVDFNTLVRLLKSSAAICAATTEPMPERSA